MFENLKEKFQSHKDEFRAGPLSGRKVALLASDGFEQSELFEPYEALIKAGADVDIITIKGSRIRAWDESDWGKYINVDKLLEEVSEDEYDCLMLPGGVMNPDHLRKEETAVDFVKGFLSKGKPIAAICHAPQLLIETGLLNGRKMTSYSSVKTDLINAGAEWVDEEVVVDSGLVTSRSPSDIPAFNKKMIEEFVEGRHYGLPNTEGFSATL